MLYFALAPSDYRKILFVLRDSSEERGESLAQHYIKTRRHLIPDSVEVWEYDESKSGAMQVYPKT